MTQNQDTNSLTRNLDDTIHNLFEYISTDPSGSIGEDYINFSNSIKTLLKLTPKEVSEHYLNYVNSLDLENMSDSDRISYNFLNNYQNESDDQFNRIMNVSKDDTRPKEFLFCLYMWLFIWH